jgi:hypothetical protein
LLQDIFTSTITDCGLAYLLWSIDDTLDNEAAILILASFRNLESFQRICELESVRQQWLQVN